MWPLICGLKRARKTCLSPSLLPLQQLDAHSLELRNQEDKSYLWLDLLSNKHRWLSDRQLWKAGFNIRESSEWGSGGGVLLRWTSLMEDLTVCSGAVDD